MNERIKELEKQSYITFKDEEWMSVSGWYIDKKDMKFLDSDNGAKNDKM